MKRWVVVLLAAFAVLALSACDPYLSVQRTDEVAIDVTIDADGSGTADMYFDDTERRPAELRAVGQAVGSRLFPSAEALDVRVDPNRGGYPFVVIDVQGLYEPGPRPEVSLDTREAVTWLLGNGTKSVDISVIHPPVPHTATWTPSPRPDDYSWTWPRISDRAMAPVGVVTLDPQPWLGIVPATLILVAIGLLVGSVVAFGRHRGRALPIALAACAFVASAVDAYVVTTTASGALMPENLGVAGIAPKVGVQVALVLMLLYLVTAPAAIVLIIIYIAVRPPRPAQVFVPAPGWPTPPEGWTPPLGWHPDPNWPPAPENWRFYRDADEVPRNSTV